MIPLRTFDCLSALKAATSNTTLPRVACSTTSFIKLMCHQRLDQTMHAPHAWLLVFCVRHVLPYHTKHEAPGWATAQQSYQRLDCSGGVQSSGAVGSCSEPLAGREEAGQRAHTPPLQLHPHSTLLQQTCKPWSPMSEKALHVLVYPVGQPALSMTGISTP